MASWRLVSLSLVTLLRALVKTTTAVLGNSITLPLANGKRTA
ncbi:MAG TPA: hypothetical protein ACN46P_05485 [Prochlorococcus sp.]|nr:hypothetical protein [Prochlorococcaceae cyanobacterium ETNP2_MAG_10]MDP6196641.1 hypothetical protein [Prochlorococcaceae cyanobacterium ETNP18_MAG_17]